MGQVINYLLRFVVTYNINQKLGAKMITLFNDLAPK